MIIKPTKRQAKKLNEDMLIKAWKRLNLSKKLNPSFLTLNLPSFVISLSPSLFIFDPKPLLDNSFILNPINCMAVYEDDEIIGLNTLAVGVVGEIYSVETSAKLDAVVQTQKQFIENEGCIMFEVEHQMIKQERDNLIRFCSSFYTQFNQKYCNDGKINTTLQEMIYELNQWEIRLKRMLCILNPKFNVTDGFNKTTNKSYRLLKGYWINDQNQKKRIFNKNVGISDGSIEHHFERFFKNRGYDVTIYMKLLNGFRIHHVQQQNRTLENVLKYPMLFISF